MNISKSKLKKQLHFVILGFVCLLIAVWQMSSTDQRVKTDFVKIHGHLSKPIQFSTGSKGNHSKTLLMQIQEYPFFNFRSTDPVLINSREVLPDSIYAPKGNEQGEEVTVIITKGDSIRIVDPESFKTQHFAVDILGLKDSRTDYLKFDLNEYNEGLNSARIKRITLASVLALLCFFYVAFKS